MKQKQEEELWNVVQWVRLEYLKLVDSMQHRCDAVVRKRLYVLHLSLGVHKKAKPSSYIEHKILENINADTVSLTVAECDQKKRNCKVKMCA